MIKKILVAIDGSEKSDHALKQAVEHSIKWNADLIIVSVIPPLSSITYMGPVPMYRSEWEDAARKSVKKILDDAITMIKERYSELNVMTRLEKGRPSDVIVELAKNENVDLIVMGSRGLGGITSTVLGSTSQAVVHICTKPILIVK